MKSSLFFGTVATLVGVVSVVFNYRCVTLAVPITIECDCCSYLDVTCTSLITFSEELFVLVLLATINLILDYGHNIVSATGLRGVASSATSSYSSNAFCSHCVWLGSGV